MLPQVGWLLRALMFLSLSILILAVQKSYTNLLDGLLLPLLGVLSLLLITLEYLLSCISKWDTSSSILSSLCHETVSFLLTLNLLS